METGTAEKNKEEKTEIPEKKEEAGKKAHGVYCTAFRQGTVDVFSLPCKWGDAGDF